MPTATAWSATRFCGDNTILDPNTGNCVINDAGVLCGTNTAFDMDSGTCLPTDMVCDNGHGV